MARATQLARRYASAIFSVGAETGTTQAIFDEVDTLTREILGSEDLSSVLLTPLHPRTERRAVVSELCRALELSEEVRAFSMILVDENRIRALPQIRDALHTLVEEAAGRLVATVTSARELGPDEVEAVRASLARRIDRDITVQTEVDPALIGGLVARVGDLLFDGSVRTQIAALRESLRRGSA